MYKCSQDFFILFGVFYLPSGFPKIVMRTLRNPIYLLVVLAQVNLAAMVAGLATFMGKFIERQFAQTASFSNLMMGELLNEINYSFLEVIIQEENLSLHQNHNNICGMFVASEIISYCSKVQITLSKLLPLLIHTQYNMSLYKIPNS